MRVTTLPPPPLLRAVRYMLIDLVYVPALLQAAGMSTVAVVVVVVVLLALCLRIGGTAAAVAETAT